MERFRKVLSLMVMVSLFALVGCQESRLTAWGLSSPDQDLRARVGILNENTEVGFVGVYNSADAVEWDELTPNQGGLYLMFHLTQEATIEDTPDPSPLGPLLEALNARPYAGLEVVGNMDGERSMQPNFIAGTVFTLDEAADIGLAVEYIDGDAIDTGQVYIGGTGRFFQF